MRRAILCAFFSLIASVAFAGPYSDAVANQRACDAAGKLGAAAFDARPAGATTEKARVLAAGSWITKNHLMDNPGTQAFKDALFATVMHAFVKATSERDAYMYGWGQCMDELTDDGAN